jgi:polysaccharide export outer membrane protein
LLSIFRIATICLLSIVLTGCTLPRGAAMQSEVLKAQSEADVPFQVVEVTRFRVNELARWPATGWSGTYRWPQAGRGPDSALIRSGDRLGLAIWDSQENSLLATSGSTHTQVPEVTVSPEGTIFVPYVGDVLVSGITPDAARARLQTALKDIAPSAQVQLSVVQGRNNSVDLAAGVGAPGRYPIESRNTRILSILSEAGGVSSSLNHPLVVLQRDGQRYEVRVEDLMRDPMLNILVRGGDQILVVEDDRSFNVLGASGQQKIIAFTKESMTAMEALSEMGGLSAARADPKGILVLRDYPLSALNARPGPALPQVVFALDLTDADGLFAARAFPINPGDTILATESPVTRVQTIMALLGSVVGFGTSLSNVAN